MAEGGLLKRWVWFIGIWLASVCVLGAVALVIRAVIG